MMCLLPCDGTDLRSFCCQVAVGDGTDLRYILPPCGGTDLKSFRRRVTVQIKAFCFFCSRVAVQI